MGMTMDAFKCIYANTLTAFFTPKLCYGQMDGFDFSEEGCIGKHFDELIGNIAY